MAPVGKREGTPKTETDKIEALCKCICPIKDGKGGGVRQHCQVTSSECVASNQRILKMQNLNLAV